MDATVLWWIAAAAAIGVELLTGTFYLLLIAVGLAAAALAAHAGWSATSQWLVAAAIGGFSCALWALKRSRMPAGPVTERNPDINIDIGQRVQVPEWQEIGLGKRHVARIHYRGSTWTAAYAGAGVPHAGEYVIRAVQGNELLLDH